MFSPMAVLVLSLTAAVAGGGQDWSSTGETRPHLEHADPVVDANVHLASGPEEVVVTIDQLHVPEQTHYHHDGPDAHVRFVWPEDAWVRGYRIDLFDSEGKLLPREMLHHVGVVQPERRQLAYPKPLRLFAVGSETATVMLPQSMGVRMRAGDPIIVYYALVNPTQRAVEGAVLRMSLTLVPVGDREPTEVFPLILNASPSESGSSRFDVPPGLTAKSAEFTLPVAGRARALGGHLHDHAVEIRLEDVLTGKVLVRLGTERDRDGGLRSIDVQRFLFSRGGLRLEADRPYRVVAIYDNPTGATIDGGAMAYLAGPFVPDDVSRWPQVDHENPIYRSDLARMTGEVPEGLDRGTYISHDHRDGEGR